MAFDTDFFYKASAGFGRLNVAQTYSYKSADDNLAAVMADGYFDPVEDKLKVNDLIYVSASDDRKFLYVASITPNSPVSIVDTAILHAS